MRTACLPLQWGWAGWWCGGQPHSAARGGGRYLACLHRGRLLPACLPACLPPAPRRVPHPACLPACPPPRRLLPKFTPGRAMMWGTILALWGTGALVATTARQLDIHTSGERQLSFLCHLGCRLPSAAAGSQAQAQPCRPPPALLPWRKPAPAALQQASGGTAALARAPACARLTAARCCPPACLQRRCPAGCARCLRALRRRCRAGWPRCVAASPSPPWRATRCGRMRGSRSWSSACGPP